MGQAKLRGTFEERKAQAIAAQEMQKEVHIRLKSKDVDPPDFIKQEIHLDPSNKFIAICLVDTRPEINCVLDQMIFSRFMFEEDKARCIRVYRTALKINYVI